MPTIREKISQLTTLTAPVTIRQALNQAPAVSNFLGGDKDLNAVNELELILSNQLTLELDTSYTLIINNTNNLTIDNNLQTEAC